MEFLDLATHMRYSQIYTHEFILIVFVFTFVIIYSEELLVVEFGLQSRIIMRCLGSMDCHTSFPPSLEAHSLLEERGWKRLIQNLSSKVEASLAHPATSRPIPQPPPPSLSPWSTRCVYTNYKSFN